MNTYQIIQRIKETRSRNEKESILQSHVDNEDLKEFFRLALSPSINFYQKKPFTHIKDDTFEEISLNDSMYWLLTNIASRRFTGNVAIEKIQEVINISNTDDAKVIMHILQKESGCDLGAATINKIWPKLIPEFPNLLATPFSEKLAEKLDWKSGVYSQRKSDGGRVSIIVEKDGTVGVFSRAGNELNVHGFFDFLGSVFAGFVIDGELLSLFPDGKFASRQISNGIFNKCVRNTLSVEESKNLHVTTWDLIPVVDFVVGFSPLQYRFRFDQLNEKFSELTETHKTCISVIHSRILHSLQQAQEHFVEEVENGEEGTMIKDYSMPWEDKRSKLQLKLKVIATGDFEVIGYKDGVGKLTGNLGSLNIATVDRKIACDMSGFSLKLRSEIYANLTGNPVSYVMVVDNEAKYFIANVGDTDIKIGSIVEVAYNAVIKGKNSEIYSLFLPRFEKTRLDKTVANTFEELK